MGWLYTCCFFPVSNTDDVKVTTLQGDITDYSSVLEATRGADVVIHAASLVDVWHKIPEATIYSVNVTGTPWRDMGLSEDRKEETMRNKFWGNPHLRVIFPGWILFLNFKVDQEVRQLLFFLYSFPENWDVTDSMFKVQIWFMLPKVFPSEDW